jgi:hypothetical protein
MMMRSMICILKQTIFGDKLKDDEMGGPGRTHRRDAYKIFVGISEKEISHMILKT